MNSPNCKECARGVLLSGSLRMSCGALAAKVQGRPGAIAARSFVWPLDYDPADVLSCDSFSKHSREGEPPAADKSGSSKSAPIKIVIPRELEGLRMELDSLRLGPGVVLLAKVPIAMNIGRVRALYEMLNGMVEKTNATGVVITFREVDIQSLSLEEAQAALEMLTEAVRKTLEYRQTAKST